MDTQKYMLTSGKSIPFWAPNAELNKTVKTDIGIVGAGIAGLTTAYLLLKEGRKVAIVDDGAIGSGETSAHLTYVLDRRLKDLVQIHGEQKIKLALESHEIAIDTIEKICEQEKIKCDFKRVDGYLFLGRDGKSETLKEEFEKYKELGFKVSRQKSKFGLRIIFHNQARFHLGKYLRGLTDAVLRKGGKIFTDHVTKIKERKLFSKTGMIKASQLVITNSQINDSAKHIAWAGQVFEPHDGLAVIGKDPSLENSYMINHSGNGLTNSTLGAIMINDMIMKRANLWQEIYDPLRMTLKTAGQLLKESQLAKSIKLAKKSEA